ncbi:Hypothetical predicted protein, partial [Cloeon dipterum]
TQSIEGVPHFNLLAMNLS